MLDRLNRLVAPTLSDAELAHRQYILNVVLLGLAVPGFIFGVIMAVLALMGLTPAAGAISGLGVQPFYLLSYWLARRGKVTLAAYIPASVIFLVMAASTFQVGIGHITTIGFAMVVATAGILIGIRPAITFVVLSIIAYSLAGNAQIQGLIPTALAPAEAVAADAIGLGLGLSVLVILNWLSNREMARALSRERQLTQELQVRSESLTEEVTERTRDLQRQTVQLQTTAEFAKFASETPDPEELMRRSVELIQSRFDFYHASIFTLDEGGTWVELAASSGEVGQRMLARGHRLGVGSASMIGWATANRLPRVSNDVETDPFFFRNPLLPETKSELVLPLTVGQRLLGALDVQSRQRDAFDEATVRTLEVIASELAIAIDSAQTQYEMLLELDRLERAYQTEARSSWESIVRAGMPTQIRIGSSGEQLFAVEEGFSSLEEAAARAETLMADEGREIAVPVVVRGEVIATIGARKPTYAETWSEEEIALLQAVAGQAGVSLEAARQREEERRRVAELEVLNRISQAVSQMLNLESLYRVVHSQIDQVLGAVDMYFALYESDVDMIEFPYASFEGKPLELSPMPVGQGLISLVIRSRQPLLLVENAKERAAELGVQQTSLPAKSWLGVPMMLGDQVLGVINVQDTKRELRFTEDDAALLTTIASQIAAAIQNTRLLDQVQRTARRERVIRQITGKVRRSPSMRTILETTAQELGRALDAARATVRLGEDTQTLSGSESLGQETRTAEERSDVEEPKP